MTRQLDHHTLASLKEKQRERGRIDQWLARPKQLDRLALDLGHRTQGIRTRLAQGIP